jgi:RND family efflux transporter MFP subunit
MASTSYFISMLIAITLLVGPAHGAGKNPPAPLVVVAPVIEKPARPHSAIPGTVIPLLEPTIASRIDGFVVNVPVQIGDWVEKGAKLVIVESLDNQRDKQVQYSVIAEAKAHLTKARNNLDRDKKLRNTPALSRQRLADRTAEVAIREAILARARTQLVQIQDQLDRHRITAPFKGIITNKSIQPGEWIREGQGVITLLDPSQLEVKALIPAHIADTLAVGDKAQTYFPKQGTTLAITLRAILPRQNPISRNRPSFWTLDNPTDTIAGEEVSLTIPLGTETTMALVLKDAIVRKGKKNLAFVVDKDTIRIAEVQLGPSVKTYFQVTKGLKVGEQVVVRGNERVRPGQKVRPVQLTGSAPASPPEIEP